jgi:cellulose synthase/poly-beta-1,6-N-acetylglucosamine synthase-like glycosyltransferase
VLVLKLLFWLSLGALLWTHLLYPLAAAALARVRTRRVRKAAIEPAVTVIVAAYNEEPVIERRLENLLALDYPADRLEVVVTSDASTDRTHELVEQFGDRVRLIVNPRGGKVAAQNRAVRETTGEIVAFSDANATWARVALRQLVPNFAAPDGA